MFIHTFVFSNKEVIYMKNTIKNMMLIGIGVGATMMYQKYNKPIMKEMEKFINKTKKKMNKELEEMM